jgi:capsular polysaccharide biosynthesis protein
MYFVDPFGGGLFPIIVLALYSAFAVFMGFYFLGAILNYWIQIFHFTKTRLEKEQKLMKINSNYNPQVTIEDIENTLKRMNKWRIPYIVCVSFITLLQIPVIAVTVTKSPAYTLVQMINFVVLLIIYLLFTIAFFVYERNILSLLDKRETREVTSIRSIRRRVRFFSAISVVTVIVSAAYSFVFTSPASVIVFKILASLEQFVATNVIFSIYFDFRPSQLRFSLAGLFTDVTSEDTTNNSLGMSTNQDSTNSATADVIVEA